DKGGALPALMLLLVIGGALLGMATWAGPRSRVTVDGVLILGAVTFGLYEALFIGSAFGNFGELASWAWIGSAGGLVLLLAAAYLWKETSEGATRPVEPAPAVAPPAA